MEFNFKIVYKPGRLNVVADSLSRIPLFTVSSVQLCASFRDNVKKLYADDELAQDVLQGNKENNGYEFKNELIYYKDRLYIPELFPITQLIAEAHVTPISGHLGVQKTYKMLKRHYYWNNMKADVELFIKDCDTRQRAKANNTKSSGLLKNIDTPSKPWHQVDMDFITHLPVSKRGNNALLVVNDYFTKRLRLIPTTDKATAKDIAGLFSNTMDCQKS